MYRLGSLGDTIVALPALRLVARAFPDAERWVLTNRSEGGKAAAISEVVGGTGLVHGFLDYPLATRSARELLRLRRSIRRLRPRTLVYLAEPRGRLAALRDAAFFRLCGIPRIVGLPVGRERQRVRALDPSLYEREGARLARCVSALGDARWDDPGSYDLALSGAEHEAARRALGRLPEDVPVLGVSIGAKVDVKDWGDANWSELLGSLSARLRWGLVAVGSADERERCDRVLASWAGPSLNLCGTLPVRVSAAVLSRCRLFIGHDSGPMHMAAAVGTPVVAVFSSRNLPGEWFPYGDGHRVLYRPMPCQGCGLDRCVERRKACIRAITVDDVRAAVLEEIGEAASAKRGRAT